MWLFCKGPLSKPGSQLANASFFFASLTVSKKKKKKKYWNTTYMYGSLKVYFEKQLNLSVCIYFNNNKTVW